MDGVHSVIWVDNFYRRRALNQPQRPYAELNCCVAAVLQTCNLPPFPGIPQCTHYPEMAVAAAALLRRHFYHLRELVESFCESGLTAAEIRVPLDVPRSGVRSPEWLPLGLFDLRMNIGHWRAKSLSSTHPGHTQ